jgi:integrase
MAVLKLKYVHSYRDRNGKTRHYFRRHGGNSPLPGVPGSAVFMEEYQRLLAAIPPVAVGLRSHVGSVSWVIEQYREISKDQPSTRSTYERYFTVLKETVGSAGFTTFTEDDVRALRNRLRNTPSLADAVVKMIRRLWRFAKEHLNMRLGPCPATEVARIHTEHEQHKAWPADLCAAIEQHPNPIVVRAYYLLRYTGQRRSDVVNMTRDHVKNGEVKLVQQKTGVRVWMPTHAALQAHLEATGTPAHYLLAKPGRGGYTPTGLSNLIAKTVEPLGFPGYSPHGLRHLAGSALAEAGCTVHEIMSILGHLTESQANEYVRQVNRKVLATNAMSKWSG